MVCQISGDFDYEGELALIIGEAAVRSPKPTP